LSRQQGDRQQGGWGHFPFANTTTTFFVDKAERFLYKGIHKKNYHGILVLTRILSENYVRFSQFSLWYIQKRIFISKTG
jgi:hypothetical protein